MAKLLRFLVVPTLVLLWSSAGADGPPDFVVPEAVPLPDDELRQITVGLLERYPQLAGSPGAKSASAHLSAQGRTDVAAVIYYPHTERRGVKVAFQAHCRRPYESKTWACHPAIRGPGARNYFSRHRPRSSRSGAARSASHGHRL
jgi:hypothetical protein